MEGQATMRWSSAALLATLMLGGCTVPDSWDREGAWRATGVNDRNLQAMIADPSHLSRGAQPSVATRGEAAAQSAGRMGFPATPAQGVGTGPGVPSLPPLRTSDVGR
jgi:hypothetical protein